MKRKHWRIAVLTILGIGLGVSLSTAQTNMPSYFDSITSFQENIAEIWKARAFIVSTTFFGLFVIIQGSFYGYRFFSKKFAVNTSQIWRKFATLLILYFILLGFYQLENIVFGLQEVALYITEEEQPITEMGMLQEGFQIALNAGTPFDGSNWWGYITGSWNGLMTGGFYFVAVWAVVLSYAIMALQYAYITIEVMIVLAIGPVPLAFGGMEWSRGVAESYISDLVELGFKVFLFYFVFGIARTILTNVAEGAIDGSMAGFGEAWWMVVEIGFIAVLSITVLAKIPGPKAKNLCRHLNPKFENLF